jgi:hypothetical protein
VRSLTKLAWCLGPHAKTAAMSLSAFQHVLSALVADRAFREAVRGDAALVLADTTSHRARCAGLRQWPLRVE